MRIQNLYEKHIYFFQPWVYLKVTDLFNTIQPFNFKSDFNSLNVYLQKDWKKKLSF